VSFDDDADEDAPGFRQPPHPDDRLWRHPSEMDAHPISSAGAFAPAPARGRSWRAVAAVGALGVVVAGVAVVGLLLEDPGSDGPGDSDPSSTAASPGAGDEEAEAAEAAAAEAVGPAIVGIDGGSGVVVRDDGLVLTSASLVADPADGGEGDTQSEGQGDSHGEGQGGDRPAVGVALPDGTRAEATVLGVDTATGLAVLDLPGEAHAAAEQADEAQVAAGSDAFNVGTAGSGAAATVGVVGATRKLQGDDDSSLDGVVEVSGEAGPVVLGGPVVDREGTVIGITTALGPGGSSYFTPIEVGHKVATDLLISGRVHHSWLGIEGMDAPAAGRPASGESGGTGAKVDVIFPGGPAAVAGLRDGDVIVEIAGNPVGRMSDLVRHLRALSPGERVALVVEREGEPVPVTVEVTLTERTAP
jgi:S1-C subfamily serine protease